jgi:hypothetical protein
VAQVLRCDNCGTVESPRFGWREVRYMGDAHWVHEDLGDKHFCSWTCVADYAARKKEGE